MSEEDGDVSLKFPLENNVIDIGLLDLLTIATIIALPLLFVTSFEDNFVVSVGCLENLIHTGEVTNPLKTDGFSGAVEDLFTAFIAGVASLWEGLSLQNEVAEELVGNIEGQDVKLNWVSKDGDELLPGVSHHDLLKTATKGDGVLHEGVLLADGGGGGHGSGNSGT